MGEGWDGRGTTQGSISVTSLLNVDTQPLNGVRALHPKSFIAETNSIGRLP